MLTRRLRDAITDWDPDVIHCHDLLTTPVGVAVARRTRAHVIFDSHEIFEEVSQITRRRRLRYKRIQRRISKRVDGFVTVNDSIAAFLCDRYPKLPEPVVVRNATLAPTARTVDDGRLRIAADLAPTDRILLYQGGFARHRGLDILVESAPLLPERWFLVMMGWGAFEPLLRRRAAQIDPDGRRIRFLPGAPHAELGLWMAGADLGVIPYENVCLNHWFCSPNKLWEYPAAGVPFLASPFPELTETVTTNGIGWLLPDPLTPEEIARTVASITEEELAAASLKCREFIERDNWTLYETRLVDLYDRISPKRPRKNGVRPDPKAQTASQQSAT